MKVIQKNDLINQVKKYNNPLTSDNIRRMYKLPKLKNIQKNEFDTSQRKKLSINNIDINKNQNINHKFKKIEQKYDKPSLNNQEFISKPGWGTLKNVGSTKNFQNPKNHIIVFSYQNNNNNDLIITEKSSNNNSPSSTIRLNTVENNFGSSTVICRKRNETDDNVAIVYSKNTSNDYSTKYNNIYSKYSMMEKSKLNNNSQIYSMNMQNNSKIFQNNNFQNNYTYRNITTRNDRKAYESNTFNPRKNHESYDKNNDFKRINDRTKRISYIDKRIFFNPLINKRPTLKQYYSGFINQNRIRENHSYYDINRYNKISLYGMTNNDNINEYRDNSPMNISERNNYKVRLSEINLNYFKNLKHNILNKINSRVYRSKFVRRDQRKNGTSQNQGDQFVSSLIGINQYKNKGISSKYQNHKNYTSKTYQNSNNYSIINTEANETEVIDNDDKIEKYKVKRINLNMDQIKLKIHRNILKLKRIQNCHTENTTMDNPRDLNSIHTTSDNLYFRDKAFIHSSPKAVKRKKHSLSLTNLFFEDDENKKTDTEILSKTVSNYNCMNTKPMKHNNTTRFNPLQHFGINILNPEAAKFLSLEPIEEEYKPYVSKYPFMKFKKRGVTYRPKKNKNDKIVLNKNAIKLMGLKVNKKNFIKVLKKKIYLNKNEKVTEKKNEDKQEVYSFCFGDYNNNTFYESKAVSDKNDKNTKNNNVKKESQFNIRNKQHETENKDFNYNNIPYLDLETI
jgi:hypothetical protein